MSARARLEVRVAPAVKEGIKRAAGLGQVPVSAAISTATEDRADRVLADRVTPTRVRAAFCHALDGLDAPPQANPALTAAAARARTLVQR